MSPSSSSSVQVFPCSVHTNTMSTSPPPPQVDSNMNAAATLSQDECHEIVKKYIQREDVEVQSFTMSPLSADLDCVMADYLRLSVSVSIGPRDDVTTIKQLQFFVKSMALNDAYLRYFVMSTLGYEKEVLFFGHLLRDVRKHLRCTEGESCRWLGTVPRCYYVRTDLLVLEDLSLLGFRTLDPMEPLTLGQCEGVLRTVARLHGASLVYEEREGKRLADAYPLLLQETVFRKKQSLPLPLQAAHLCCIFTAHVLLDLMPRFTEVTCHRDLHILLDSAMEDIHELVKPSDKYRNVLCHRDLWVNNMMFADEANGDVSVRLVDLLTLHLEPPAHDVLLFLHLCTVRDMRKAHGRRLLELYHQTLADVLRQHDLDIDSILPLQVFLQSCEEAKHVALILAAYTLQVTMLPLPKDRNMDNYMFERAALVGDVFYTDQRFHDRMTETMQELVETCFLPRLGNQPR